MEIIQLITSSLQPNMHGKVSFLSLFIKCSIRHTDQYSILSNRLEKIWSTRATVLHTTTFSTAFDRCNVWKRTTATAEHKSMSIFFRTSYQTCLHFQDEIKQPLLSASFGLTGTWDFVGWDRLTWFSFSSWDVHLSRSTALRATWISMRQSWWNAEVVQ